MFRALGVVALCALSVLGQTVTTTNAVGVTVVEVITTDPLGNPTTQILQTLTQATTPTTAVVAATTITTTNAAGVTVVEVVSTNAAGDSVTRTVTTLTSTLAATTTAVTNTVPTTTDQQQGPVGAPTSTNTGQPTVYTYTTTDANGQTIAVADTFTPTFPPSQAPKPLSTGTIMPYSEYTALYGTSAAAIAHNSNSAPHRAAAGLGMLLVSAFALAGASVVLV